MNASTLRRAIPCSAAILLLVGPSGCASARRPLTVQQVAADVVLEDPSDVVRWIEYGRVCEFSDNNGGAIQAYEHALELDDSNITAYEHLGAVYSKVGQLDKANETYRRAFDKGVVPENPIRVVAGLLSEEFALVNGAKIGELMLEVRHGDAKVAGFTRARAHFGLEQSMQTYGTENSGRAAIAMM